MFLKNAIRAAVAVVIAAAASASYADVVTLDFEGVGSQARIENFYNGGTDSAGNSGTNYGVQFGANALGLKESDPAANIALLPSAETGMIFLSGSAILNYSAGFTTGFSFWYSTVSFAGDVEVFDDVNAGGNSLGIIKLAALGAGPSAGNPFSNWATGSLTFSGTAKSINFGGTVNQVVYDDITFGSSKPGGGGNVPEPTTLALVGAALLAAGAARRKA